MSAERKVLEKQRNEYNELKRQFDKCPLSLREQLQEQLSRVSVLTQPTGWQQWVTTSNSAVLDDLQKNKSKKFPTDLQAAFPFSYCRTSLAKVYFVGAISD